MMIKLAEIVAEMQPDIDSVNEWVDEIYNKYFSGYFADQHEYYKRLKSKDRPITDAELEDILTTMPLELFSVSEALSQFKISEEVVKLKVKETEIENFKNSQQSSETKRKEEAANSVLEHKLLITVYEAVAERVGKEISYSRELIMGCKKIWDGRRATDNSNPVGNVVNEGDLPDYAYNGKASTGGGRTYVG